MKSVHYWWSHISFASEWKELTCMLDPLLYRWDAPPVVIRCVHWTMQRGVLQTWITAQCPAIAMVATSFRRHNDVIISSLTHWAVVTTKTAGKTGQEFRIILIWLTAKWAEIKGGCPHEFKSVHPVIDLFSFVCVYVCACACACVCVCGGRVGWMLADHRGGLLSSIFFSLIHDSSVGLSEGFSLLKIRFLGSNLAFSRGRQLVSFRLENRLLVPDSLFHAPNGFAY